MSLRPAPRQRLMHVLIVTVSVGVVPLAVLLFAQWPLRELVQAGARQVNDVAQIVFAVYAAVAVTAASRANTHLAAASTSRESAATPRAWRAWALLLCLGPWAGFVLWAAAPQIAASLQGLEKFGDTFTPGFFLIKLALGLMLVLILLHALFQVGRNPP